MRTRIAVKLSLSIVGALSLFVAACGGTDIPPPTTPA